MVFTLQSAKSGYSPAPNQARLVWGAPRGQRFNIYAQAPGAPAWTKILSNVTFTSWMGEGLAAGEWKFQGEAINGDGLGEMSEEITVPVAATMAA